MKNVNVVPILTSTHQAEEEITYSQTEYKEVVIIGNGPSGIALSYMLDGNVPFYNQEEHPDEMLTARLRYVSPTESLIEQDLSNLSAGLEGRSTNPISLLVDALEHPNADFGVQHKSLLEWRNEPGKEIDHVVLGKGLPGGSWHAMDPHILTLSLGSWMALPGLPYTGELNSRTSAGDVANYYQTYVKEQGLEKYFHMNTIVTEIKIVNKCKRKNKIKMFNKMSNEKCWNNMGCSCVRDGRRPGKKCRLICCKCCFEEKDGRMKSCSCFMVGANNYRIYEYDDTLVDNDFAEAEQTNPKLNGNSDSKNEIVCSILERSQSFTCDKRNYLSCNKFCYNNNYNSNNNNNRYDEYYDSNKDECLCQYKWQVNGYDYLKRKHFIYYTKNVVLATGSSDQPNRLGIAGEDEYPNFIVHNLRDLEDAFDNMSEDMKQDPVLIIGAGLSAADATIVARKRFLPVLHVFRRKNATLDKQLPENMYPEYHNVHKMMSDAKGRKYPLYLSLPEHKLIGFDPIERTCSLENVKSGEVHVRKVSYIGILIGSRPNLNFLPSTLSLGVNKKLEIDCKTNPLDISPLTHQIGGNSNNLYALGPLAGDNFVRFIPGGALAIASDLHKKRNNHQQT